MVSEKKIFLSFSHYKSMGVHDPLGRGQFGPHRLDWQYLCRGPLNIATYKIYKPWDSWFLRRRFFCFSHYKSMGAISWYGGHLDLWTVTIFTNFQSPYNTRLHIKFEEIWPRGFREEIVLRCEWTDRRITDDGRRVIIIAHPQPLAQVS